MNKLGRAVRSGTRVSDTFDALRRAFAEFLTVPTCLILFFLILAVGTYLLDRSRIEAIEPLRGFLKTRVFADARATSDLLGTIAGSLITVTSITISLLLVALQQSAASMTAEVFDQFLRRRTNQIYFGYFVGLALFALVTLATVDDPFNPVFGAALAFLLTSIALYLLILLLYSTINQMRPVEIVETIHNAILAARERQRSILTRTRRVSRHEGAVSVQVRSRRHGYVTHLDLDRIGRAAAAMERDVEVVLHATLGSFVGSADPVAEIRTHQQEDASVLEEALHEAVRLERQRTFDFDPTHGIEQLEAIAWTSISSSKSNPAPGLIIIRSLRDVMARWSLPQEQQAEGAPVPVVYHDNVFARLMCTLESLGVVSTESMQHQCFTEVVRTFAVMFDRLPKAEQGHAENVILRLISGLGDHVLTTELDAALSNLVTTLEASARPAAAAAVQAARQGLAESIGQLSSRSARVPR